MFHLLLFRLRKELGFCFPVELTENISCGYGKGEVVINLY